MGCPHHSSGQALKPNLNGLSPQCLRSGLLSLLRTPTEVEPTASQRTIDRNGKKLVVDTACPQCWCSLWWWLPAASTLHSTPVRAYLPKCATAQVRAPSLQLGCGMTRQENSAGFSALHTPVILLSNSHSLSNSRLLVQERTETYTVNPTKMM